MATKHSRDLGTETAHKLWLTMTLQINMELELVTDAGTIYARR